MKVYVLLAISNKVDIEMTKTGQNIKRFKFSVIREKVFSMLVAIWNRLILAW